MVAFDRVVDLKSEAKGAKRAFLSFPDPYRQGQLALAKLNPDPILNNLAIHLRQNRHVEIYLT